MAILALPNATSYRGVRFSLAASSISHVSPLDKSTQTVEIPGARWRLEASLKPMKRAAAAPWMALLTELLGQTGRFHAGDPGGVTPLGAVGASTPLVNGAAQTGKALITDGWDFSVTGVLAADDYFAIDLPSGGRSLHKLTAAANSDGAGNATLAFAPALRESPANNAALIVQSATCVMRLLDDAQADWTIDEAGFYRIAFAAVESFNVG